MNLEAKPDVPRQATRSERKDEKPVSEVAELESGGELAMRKTREVSEPTSCFNRARDDELLFVLLGRDAAAPATIEFWVKERIRLGKNKWGDPQIEEAMGMIREMIQCQLPPGRTCGR